MSWCRSGWKIFQFTPLREGRQVFRITSDARDIFQFTPLREGRRACRFLVFCGFPFQFTPLREGRRGRRARGGRQRTISIHAPPRGATVFRITSDARDIFQFTPLREGRHLSRWRTPFPISFQFTPLREGRHEAIEDEKKALEISIHAPPRGATQERDESIYDAKAFQFTPLREGRRQGISGWRLGSPISIHAPPRGATSPSPAMPVKFFDFNSRPSARGDARSMSCFL